MLFRSQDFKSERFSLFPAKAFNLTADSLIDKYPCAITNRKNSHAALDRKDVMLFRPNIRVMCFHKTGF